MAETTRTDVTWTDGIPYCDKCSYFVSPNGHCSPDCFGQRVDAARDEGRAAELKDVLKHIRSMLQSPCFCDTCEDTAAWRILSELEEGEHRGANTAKRVRWNHETKRYEDCP